MQKLIAAIALSMAWPAFATTPAPLVLDELVDVSEQVALVRVTSGRLNSLTDDCGVRFVGQIETSWKGSQILGATIEFDMAAAGIGETYVVYLVPHRHPKADVWASTNSDDARARSEWMKKCEGVLPRYRVAQRGIFRVWQRGRTKAEIRKDSPSTPADHSAS